MYSSLVSAGTSTESGFPFTNLLILTALVVVGYPLFRKVRSAASENRKRRWVKDGLMDPPATELMDPPATEPGSEAGSGRPET